MSILSFPQASSLKIPDFVTWKERRRSDSDSECTTATRLITCCDTHTSHISEGTPGVVDHTSMRSLALVLDESVKLEFTKSGRKLRSEEGKSEC
jgi:hypothetical protein